MGHSDVQTTMNIYNEIQETKKKEAFEDLNDKIKNGIEQTLLECLIL